jgi:hypothetical protein
MRIRIKANDLEILDVSGEQMIALLCAAPCASTPMNVELSNLPRTQFRIEIEWANSTLAEEFTFPPPENDCADE